MGLLIGAAFWLAVVLLLAGVGVVPILADEPEPAPLYGTEAFDIETPWALLMYTIPGGLTGAAAIHFVFITLAADRLVASFDAEAE